MSERQVLENLLKDAEAMVAKIKAMLAEQLHDGDSSSHTTMPGSAVNASAGAAIERVQRQKTSDDPGNY